VQRAFASPRKLSLIHPATTALPVAVTEVGDPAEVTALADVAGVGDAAEDAADVDEAAANSAAVLPVAAGCDELVQPAIRAAPASIGR
jgi:hypothetical protein